MKKLAICLALLCAPAFAQQTEPIRFPTEGGTVIFRPNGNVVLRFEKLDNDNCAWTDRSAPPPTCTDQVQRTIIREIILRPAASDVARKTRIKNRDGENETNDN